MKRLLILAAFVALTVLGGNFYYTHEIKSALDEMAAGLSPFGELSYDKVRINFSGEVRITELAFRPSMEGQRVSMEALVLRPGSLLKLHRLTDELDAGHIPEQLGLSLLGLTTRLDGPVMRAAAADDSPSMLAAGCGEQTHFGPAQWSAMGYSELVLDAHIDYEIVGSGQILELQAGLDARRMGSLNTRLEMRVGAPSREAYALGMAMENAHVMSLTLDYEDDGYLNRVFDYCTEQTGLARSAYIDHHLAAWQDYWRLQGFEPGPNITGAYRTLLDSAGQLRLRFTPTAPLPVGELANLTPQRLAYRMQADVQANRRLIGDLDMGVVDPDVRSQVRTAQRDARTQRDARQQEQGTRSQRGEGAAEPEQSGAVRIPLTELAQHQGANVRILLQNNRRFHGSLEEIGEESLRLKQMQSGGHAILPISFNSIAEIRLAD